MKTTLTTLFKSLAIPLAVGTVLAVLVVTMFLDSPPVSSENGYTETGYDRYDQSGEVNTTGNDTAYFYPPIPSTRELKEYYSRRQYPGSPPIIPHEVSESKGDFNCLNCHQLGGFVARFNAYTPITPHPEFVNCNQCHVAMSSSAAFKSSDIDWVSVMPPKLKRTAIAGGPPPIPHSLNLRENCLSCHAGPAAVKQIRTSHPERVNCTQCHVPQNSSETWARR